VQIVGVGFDSPSQNAAWAAREDYLFELWTDDDKTLAVAYGSVSSDSASFAGRVTVVIGPDGEQVLEYAVSDLGTHPAQVLSDVTAIYGE
jgi:peroxiredoxin